MMLVKFNWTTNSLYCHWMLWNLVSKPHVYWSKEAGN
jgi:hypothetical protein